MSIIPYDRTAAVDYARKWAYARNPKYADFSHIGGDCTNFISQCLVAGGMPMNFSTPLGWYFSSLGNRSAAFSGVQFLYNFLTNSSDHRRGPFAQECEISRLEIGDIIQLSAGGESFTHSLLVVQSGSDPHIATHSFDAFDRALSSYNFAAVRCLHITGGYH